MSRLKAVLIVGVLCISLGGGYFYLKTVAKDKPSQPTIPSSEQVLPLDDRIRTSFEKYWKEYKVEGRWKDEFPSGEAYEGLFKKVTDKVAEKLNVTKEEILKAVDKDRYVK